MSDTEDLLIPLRLTPGVESITLRSLRGRDEIVIQNTGTKNLLSFLESLIQSEQSTNKINSSQIVTADRDRLLALFYISLYGAKIESTVSCKECDQKFDLDFRLDELLQHYQPSTSILLNSGKYELESGVCFRLPNGEDEILIEGLNIEEAEKQLFERCLLNGDIETDKEKVQQKMAELAPLLTMNMQTICPECSHVQEVRFDIQSFFLTRLYQEKSTLLREIHSIASHYHWSHQEILELPRNLRKQYAALIES